MSIVNTIAELYGFLRHPARLFHPNTYSNARFIDFLKSKGAVIGEKTRFISPSHCVVDPGRIDYITIGRNCCLSNVTILAHDYSWYVLLEAFNDVLPDAGGEVIIGNNVFVGYQACILKGTSIGDNCIIGARSVVKGEIPSNTVWAGVPAKMICTLEDFYEKKMQLKIKDAIYRRDFVRRKKNRNPSIDEMGVFAVLFLDRTEECWKEYLEKIEFNGIKNSEMFRNYFYSSVPFFSSFEDFLNYQHH